MSSNSQALIIKVPFKKFGENKLTDVAKRKKNLEVKRLKVRRAAWQMFSKLCTLKPLYFGQEELVFFLFFLGWFVWLDIVVTFSL